MNEDLEVKKNIFLLISVVLLGFRSFLRLYPDVFFSSFLVFFNFYIFFSFFWFSAVFK